MKWKLLIGLAIAGFCLYFVFKGISIPDLLHALRAAQLHWILLALAIYTVGFGLRTWRLEILMRPIQPIPGKALFGPMIIGFLANNILPFRMGEFVRAQVTGQKFHISRTASLGAILVERLCDTISFLTTFLIVATFLPFPSFVKKGAFGLGAACILAVVALVIITHHRHRFHQILERLPLGSQGRHKIMEIINNFAQGVSGMTDWRFVLEALILSLGVWTMEGTMLYFIGRAFDIGLGYPQSFFLLFFMGLSVTLPQAPGYVGTYEWFGVSALSLLGIPKERGLPVILTIHACQFIYIFILGTLCLWSEKLSLTSMVHTASQTTAE